MVSPVQVTGEYPERDAGREARGQKFQPRGSAASQTAQRHQSSLTRLRWPQDGQRRKVKALVKPPNL